VYSVDLNPPPPGRGGISANVIWGKNMKRGNRKKEENGKEKGKMTENKWEIKVKKGKIHAKGGNKAKTCT
jgi:hypothetical protein